MGNLQNELIVELKNNFVDTYVLYLKTQIYHWHVRGMHFISLHTLFEQSYTELAQAIDVLAERLVMLNSVVPATLTQLLSLTSLEEPCSDFTASQMLVDLCTDHESLMKAFSKTLRIAQSAQDEGTANLISERLLAHEKMRWMLSATVYCDDESN